LKRKKYIYTNSFLADGHLNEETIAFCAEALLLGKMESIDESLKKHIKECQVCKTEVFAVYEEINSNKTLKSQLIENTEYLHSDTKPKVKISKFLKIAALLLIFFGIGFIYYFYRLDNNIKISDNILVIENDSLNQEERENDSSIISDNKKDSITKATIQHNIDNELLAMQMNESDFFENLISSDFRDNSAFEVIEPKNGKSYSHGQKIEFKFKDISPTPLELSIYKNTEERIFRTDSIYTTIYTYPEILDRGLYYWKIRAHKELIGAGKFYIK
jgi:hypothetical protein